MKSGSNDFSDFPAYLHIECKHYNMQNNWGNFCKVAFLTIGLCEIFRSLNGMGMAQVAQW